MGILDLLSGRLGGKIADIVAKHVGDKDLATKIAGDFQNLLANNEQALKLALIDQDKEADTQQQETIRAELAQTDEYTKRTRPMLVRRSWWVSAGYVGISVASNLLVMYVHPIQVDWSILTLLMSPVLTYFAVNQQMGFARPMLYATVGSLIVYVIAVYPGPETKGMVMTADLDVIEAEVPLG